MAAFEDPMTAVGNAVYTQIEWAIDPALVELIDAVRAMVDHGVVADATTGREVDRVEAALEAIAPRPRCPQCGVVVTAAAAETADSDRVPLGPESWFQPRSTLRGLRLSPCDHVLGRGSGWILAVARSTSGALVYRQATLVEVLAP